MEERRFNLAAFNVHVGAQAKERPAIRQALVRGLKEYHEHRFGYDRHGAETVLLLSDRMSVPYIYGFGLRRILNDRRLSVGVKRASAEFAIDILDYPTEMGVPYDLIGALSFLLRHGGLDVRRLRYALVASAHDPHPFRALDKSGATGFFARLLTTDDMPKSERLFWAHSLLARHDEPAGAAELIHLLLGDDRFAPSDRLELARAWVHARQPRLVVPLPAPDHYPHANFIAARMPFWVEHAPSWPTLAMARYGLVWMARLGDDPLTLARTYVAYRGSFAEQFHAAVADILTEHRASLSIEEVREVVDQGACISGSAPARRRFYRLGADLYGSSYLERATEDTADSVRQWAARQLEVEK